MADVSSIKIGDTGYPIKDAYGRDGLIRYKKISNAFNNVTINGNNGYKVFNFSSYIPDGRTVVSILTKVTSGSVERLTVNVKNDSVYLTNTFSGDLSFSADVIIGTILTSRLE